MNPVSAISKILSLNVMGYPRWILVLVRKKKRETEIVKSSYSFSIGNMILVLSSVTLCILHATSKDSFEHRPSNPELQKLTR